MRRTTLRTLPLALLSLLLPACAWLQGEPAPAPPGIDAAGLELPRVVGPYVVALVQYGGDPTQGAFVRYLPSDSLSPLPRIDVVVYPTDGSVLPREVALSHDAMLYTDETSPQIDDTFLLAEGRFPIHARADTAWRAAYYLTIQDVPQRSLVYLHTTAGRFVKARTSFTLHPGYDPDDRIDDVVAALFAVAMPVRAETVDRRP